MSWCQNLIDTAMISPQQRFFFHAKISGFIPLSLRQEAPDTLFFNRASSINGATERGLIAKNMLDAVESPIFSQNETVNRQKSRGLFAYSY